jgi:hypothetical protein
VDGRQLRKEGISGGADLSARVFFEVLQHEVIAERAADDGALGVAHVGPGQRRLGKRHGDAP